MKQEIGIYMHRRLRSSAPAPIAPACFQIRYTRLASALYAPKCDAGLLESAERGRKTTLFVIVRHPFRDRFWIRFAELGGLFDPKAEPPSFTAFGPSIDE